jgi:hypothetical protein
MVKTHEVAKSGDCMRTDVSASSTREIHFNVAPFINTSPPDNGSASAARARGDDWTEPVSFVTNYTFVNTAFNCRYCRFHRHEAVTDTNVFFYVQSFNWTDFSHNRTQKNITPFLSRYLSKLLHAAVFINDASGNNTISSRNRKGRY